MNHSQFICGYNKQLKTFKILNFNTNRKYSLIDVPFINIQNAFDKSPETYSRSDLPGEIGKTFEIILIQEIKYWHSIGHNRSINMDVINKQLHNYFYSSNSSIDSYFFTCLQDGKWGMDIYNRMIEDSFDTDNLHMLVFYNILEHKTIMKDRFITLNKMGLINNYENDIEDIVNLSRLLLNLVLKSKMGNINKKPEIKNCIKKIKEKEIIFFQEYFDKG